MRHHTLAISLDYGTKNSRDDTFYFIWKYSWEKYLHQKQQKTMKTTAASIKRSKITQVRFNLWCDVINNNLKKTEL